MKEKTYLCKLVNERTFFEFMGKKYVVKFAGLANGIHKYEFRIDRKLFEEFEAEDILDADLFLDFTMEKSERQLVFLFKVKGGIVVACDRCLEEMSVPLNFEREYYVGFGDTYEETDENMCVIPRNEHSFDLSKLIYEYVMLSKPMRCVHGEVEGNCQVCSQEMTDILNTPELRENQGTDPRWDVLKQINFE